MHLLRYRQKRGLVSPASERLVPATEGATKEIVDALSPAHGPDSFRTLFCIEIALSICQVVRLGLAGHFSQELYSSPACSFLR